jgi:hypothetical protein
MSAIARNAKIAKSDDLKTWPRVRVFQLAILAIMAILANPAAN